MVSAWTRIPETPASMSLSAQTRGDLVAAERGSAGRPFRQGWRPLSRWSSPTGIHSVCLKLWKLTRSKGVLRKNKLCNSPLSKSSTHLFHSGSLALELLNKDTEHTEKENTLNTPPKHTHTHTFFEVHTGRKRLTSFQRKLLCHLPMKNRKLKKKVIFYWGITDIEHCISVRCTA